MLNSLKELRGKLNTDMNALLTASKGNMNAEDTAKFDAMFAEDQAVKANIERVEKAAALDAELRTSVRPAPVVLGTETASAAAADLEVRKSAFDSYLRKGLSEMTSVERRALSVSTGSAGGYLIPAGFSNELETALKYYGGMRQAGTVFSTESGNILPWPTNNDTSNVAVLLSAMTTPGTSDAGDTTFGVVNYNAWTYGTKYIAVPNELLQDSAFDLQKYIGDLFVERMGRGQNAHFTTGTGTNQPSGIVTGATVGVTAATGGTTSITYANLVDLVGSVDVDYRVGAKFMFNDATLTLIRKLVDTQGRPLLGLGLNGAVSDQILGYNYVINNDVAVPAANAKSMLFGQLSKYRIRDVKGLALKRLDEIGAYQNQTIFVGFARTDGHLLDAGTAPVRYFAQSAS